MMNKKSIALLLTISCLLGVVSTGCGSKSDAAVSSQSASASASSEPAVAPEKAEKQHLRIYLNSGNMPETFNQINELFQERYPEIELEVEPMPPTDQVENILKTKAATDDLPDIFNIWPGFMLESYANQGLLEDLSDKPYMKEMVQSAVDTVVYDGKTYAFPMNFAPVGVYYDKDLFAKYNLEIPKTWTEFLNLCETLKGNSIVPIASPFKDAWTTALPCQMAASQLLYPQKPNFDADVRSGKDSYANDEWKEILNRFVTLRDKEYFNSDALGLSIDQCYMMFAKGEAGMMLQGSWSLPSLQGMKPDMNLGMFALPAVEDVSKVVSLTTMEIGFAVASQSKNKEAADKYIAFYTEPEIYKLYIEGNMGISTLNTVQISGSPVFNDMVEYIKTGKTHDYPQTDPNIPDVQRKSLQQLFMKELTPEETLNAIQAVQEQSITK